MGVYTLIYIYIYMIYIYIYMVSYIGFYIGSYIGPCCWTLLDDPLLEDGGPWRRPPSPLLEDHM